MKLTKVWVVRDGTPNSELADLMFELTMDRHLENYILGSGRGVWALENHTIYTKHAEALADAKQRLVRVPRGTYARGGKRRHAAPSTSKLGALVSDINRLVK